MTNRSNRRWSKPARKGVIASEVDSALSTGSVRFPSSSETTPHDWFPSHPSGWEPVVVGSGEGSGSSGELIARGFDVLLLEVRHWGDLPRRASLGCRLRASSLAFVVTNTRAVHRALSASKRPVFDPLEFEALSIAAQLDRASPLSLLGWCTTKRLDPTWKLGLADAMGGLPGARLSMLTIQIGFVLKRWGAQLASVAYDDEVPSA